MKNLSIGFMIILLFMSCDIYDDRFQLLNNSEKNIAIFINMDDGDTSRIVAEPMQFVASSDSASILFYGNWEGFFENNDQVKLHFYLWNKEIEQMWRNGESIVEAYLGAKIVTLDDMRKWNWIVTFP